MLAARGSEPPPARWRGDDASLPRHALQCSIVKPLSSPLICQRQMNAASTVNRREHFPMVCAAKARSTPHLSPWLLWRCRRRQHQMAVCALTARTWRAHMAMMPLSSPFRCCVHTDRACATDNVKLMSRDSVQACSSASKSGLSAPLLLMTQCTRGDESVMGGAHNARTDTHAWHHRPLPRTGFPAHTHL